MENMENVENIEVVNYLNAEKRRNGGLESSRDNNGFAEAILKTITTVVKNYLNAEEQRSREAFTNASIDRALPNSVSPFLCVKNKTTLHDLHDLHG